MLFQLILDIIVFFMKFIFKVVMALFLIPVGILMGLKEIAPEFCMEAGFWFWTVLSTLTIIAYIIFWRPIIWLMGAISILNAGNE